ncbi:hypothetical protein acdb102_27780 [Acidothermaceae bacterium B102]|nr:hypothetical protein acdb102_27780 [Acidothermaceae bacterium B102]
MTRGLQRALLMLAVFLVGLVGVAFFAGSQRHRSQAPVILPGPQDAAQLAAARAFIDHLTVPAAARRDPYDSVCRVTTTYCVTSTTLPENDLVSQVADRVVGAGAKQNNLLGSCRVQSPAAINCTIRFDVGGARIEIRGGPGPYVAVLPADVPESRTPQGQALGPWSEVNPLPAGWVTTATCEMVLADGCQWYESDQPGEPNRASVPGTLPLVYAQAGDALIAKGFLVNRAPCRVASNGAGACLLGGFQFRTLGGRDGESVQVMLRAADSARVTIEIRVNAR